MATDNRLIAAHLTGAMLGRVPFVNAEHPRGVVAAKLYFEVLQALDTEGKKHASPAPKMGIQKGGIG